MDCSFTYLTVILIVQLEDILQEKLLIPETRLFRQFTIYYTIHYSIQDSGNEVLLVFGLKVIQGLVLPAGKRGVIYIRNYIIGEIISRILQYPFYKIRADNKGELLQEWIRNWDWIVTISILGTGINIKDIIFVVHINQLYRLISFAQ
jgi:hypothetical protein